MLGLSIPTLVGPGLGAQAAPSCWQAGLVRSPGNLPSTTGRRTNLAHDSATLQPSRSVACSVAAIAQLSTYAFPPKAPAVLQWFENCVEEIVKHLDEAPFLQLVYPDRRAAFERHQVNASIVAVPKIWRSVADYLSRSQPDILVLVHPLDDVETDKCILHHQSRELQRDVITGIASHPAHTTNLQQRLANCAGQLPAPRGTDILQGKVGECCDEDEGEHHAPHGNVAPPPPNQAANGVSFYQTGNKAEDAKRGHFARPTGAYPELSESLQSDWGLVVQSKSHSGTEGCYVLRTTRNSNPTADCQCTHYSLTRVCQGEAIGTQLGSAWLAD